MDNVREAARVNIAFGPIVDPVGAGAERALAVLHQAIPLGLGEKFAEAALRGCWSRGIDLASNSGLTKVAVEAGISRDVVAKSLADSSWRDQVDANRQQLFDAGLWGVPSFRVNGKPAHWGQDRIWLLEQDLLSEAIQ
jgi:2-hydroxychromene-2-carboxylate isomerase